MLLTTKCGKNTAINMPAFRSVFEPVFLTESEDDERIERLAVQICNVQRRYANCHHKKLKKYKVGEIFGVEYEKKLGLE